MAPTKPKTSSTKGSIKQSSKPSGNSALKNKKRTASSVGKAVQKKSAPKSGPLKKKRRVYTEKELGVPTLNTITPAGVQKPKGKKKGKVFVDDQESMMTILAMVNADKEGQIESKMMKARQMEEIREARRKEAEARQHDKRSKLEETKDSLRKRHRRKLDAAVTEPDADTQPAKARKSSQKRVSFG
ncbi:60S ribosomal subunit assembly/export protein [Coniosporium apollinis]|uniref:60S ribosomal subunit assembly/export protein n=2 Tax=Coniosporium TaxID=2810619 RepID=A0ABQ9NSP6_9PEZI|nr:60S ribosomal subunit assembly/export protein [Cladosporium sp. JES 115]KAJ9665430.1 60S ribosomal subunit assembly/export protein [Coniosporium apollinis]